MATVFQALNQPFFCLPVSLRLVQITGGYNQRSSRINRLVPRRGRLGLWLGTIGRIRLLQQQTVKFSMIVFASRGDFF